MPNERDPYIIAWGDQFKALLREKVLLMMEAAKVTGWNSISHVFDDPFDDDKFRLIYENGEFYICNLMDTEGRIMQIDLGHLGVA